MRGMRPDQTSAQNTSGPDQPAGPHPRPAPGARQGGREARAPLHRQNAGATPRPNPSPKPGAQGGAQNAPPAGPLDKPVQYLRGVGPARARLLANLGIHTVGDLIEFFPFRYEDQGRPQPIDTLILDEPATVLGMIEQVSNRGGYYKPMVTATVVDGSGKLKATWFNAPYLGERLARGQVVRLYGQVGVHHDTAQMVNPRIEWLDPDAGPEGWNYTRVVPVYHAVLNLNSAQISRLVETALAEALPAIRETLPETLRQAHRLSGRAEAIKAMHQPASLEEVAPARRRLAYEELFQMQLAISLQRRWSRLRARAPVLPTTPEIDSRIRRRFPFPLTRAQDKVIAEISADLARERPMTRLLQGDVGSGKTVVALYAALVAIANRQQCAILAPTAVLAAQHYANVEKYLAGSRVNRCLLTGNTPEAQRRKALREIAAGRMDLIVGTQALLESRVRFYSLGLVIVDEQHKFGVSQRAALRGKSKETPAGCVDRRGVEAGRRPLGQSDKETRGQGDKARTGAGAARSALPPISVPHYLVMTATPIPRTLSMTVFGDLDVSTIDQLPPGRQPIVTRVIRPPQERQAWQEVRQRIAAGEQAYVVYPLVEESDSLDLKAATAEVDRVSRDLLPGARVGLLHGRMKKADKQAVMRQFASGHLDVLVSTTVIEVGVDVPNATVMVIQHAERYGLAALHQLRGRVGRGSKPSICLLLTDSNSELANRRLTVLCETTDGFRIAEEDLRMRGPGELLGTRQHGWPEFRVANLVEDVELLMHARNDAARIVRKDPSLLHPEHAALKAELRRRFREKVAFIDVA
ncbi:MAG: ATP-dependent DNA helicase RecG [Phycisphaerae bacterium]|nr:ATP-dependent DNA helicase RecG [Phycisphaerae bacterium]